MDIREAKLGDEKPLVDLFLSLDKETDFMLFEPGERSLSINAQAALIDSIAQSENRLLLVSIENEKIIGFLGATGGQANRTRHTASFVVGVLKAHWGEKIATSLLSGFESWAKSSGFHRLEMTVMDSNNRAKNFYINNGYAIEGIRKNALRVNDVFVNELYMSKLI